jgi:AcrR family transcriptional regulator
MTNIRTYKSPLRDQKAQETREAILQALYDLMSEEKAPDEIPIEVIAQRAGIQRRTVFRHFPVKSDLLTAFWPWLNDRIGAATVPQSAADILAGPKTTFPKFDRHEGAMRAAIHSQTGREMRLGTVADRRANFAKALAPVLKGLSPQDRRRVEALAHLLYSASAWEVLKDYGGLTGAEAGDAASWTLEVILSAVTNKGLDLADLKLVETEKNDEN